MAKGRDDDNLISVLHKVNERLAINAFSNSLKNSKLRTFIKAKNFNKLKDAINCDKEEELIKTSNNAQATNMFYVRTVQNFGNGNRNNNGRRFSTNNYCRYGANRKNMYENNNNNQSANFSNQ